MFGFNQLERAPRTSVMKARESAKLQRALDEADAVLIGAGAGLSTAAGFTYSGERFERYFADFQAKYGFADMYSGGFYPYQSLEEFWAFWSRNIWVNRYASAPSKLYQQLFELVRDRDHFVLTTNVDHQFQQAGFDKARLFYTQGDYGLLQCMEPCHQKTYDNRELVQQMLEARGFEVQPDGSLTLPEGRRAAMRIPSELVPRCPKCGKPMTTNLRCDDSFVEDEGWHKAQERYHEFRRRHKGMKLLLLELGVGYNTPVIIKYPFWQMTAENRQATYACLNKGEAVCPSAIAGQSVLIDDDLAATIAKLRR